MLINGTFAPAAGGSADAVPLCWWQGWSGGWYVSSVMALQRVSCAAPGHFLLVRRTPIGQRIPLMVGWSRNIEPALCREFADPLMAAVRAGANEIHVNLVGEELWQHEEAAVDIARGWDLSVFDDLAGAIH